VTRARGRRARTRRPATTDGRVPVAAWPETHPGRLLSLLAERLESFLEGDELAFETLGEALEDEGFSGDDLEAAILALRRGGAEFAAAAGPIAAEAPEKRPGRAAQRVWSSEERASLSPEAWGYLLDLKRRGSLDDGQFEKVLGILTRSGPGMPGWVGEDPVGVDLAREVAARVVLEREPRSESDDPHGETDPIH
jgi:uncharacterized protein Smg (DUF494 family)